MTREGALLAFLADAGFFLTTRPLLRAIGSEVRAGSSELLGPIGKKAYLEPLYRLNSTHVRNLNPAIDMKSHQSLLGEIGVHRVASYTSP